MDHAVVAHGGYRHTGGIQFAGIGLAFITQHIGAGRLDQRGRQAFELSRGGPQRRGVDLGALVGVGGVVVPGLYQFPIGPNEYRGLS